MGKSIGPRLPPKFLWQKLQYPNAEAAREVGIDPNFKTYEWLHAVAEKAEGRRIPWPWKA